jgi:hypothetical protein
VVSISHLWYIVELRLYLHVVFCPRVSSHSRNTGNMHSLVTKFNFSNRNNYMEVFLEPDLPELAASCNQRTSSQAPRSLYETSCTPQEYHSQYQDHERFWGKRLASGSEMSPSPLGHSSSTLSYLSHLLNPMKNEMKILRRSSKKTY